MREEGGGGGEYYLHTTMLASTKAIAVIWVLCLFVYVFVVPQLLDSVAEEIVVGVPCRMRPFCLCSRYRAVLVQPDPYTSPIGVSSLIPRPSRSSGLKRRESHIFSGYVLVSPPVNQ